VWLSDGAGGQRPDFIVDQSSFIDSAAGMLVPSGNKEPRTIEGRTPMTSTDCEWIIANESTFEDRIQKFLAAGSLLIGGVQRPVKKIEVCCIRIFSANGNKDTVHGAKRGTTTLESWRGITRPWHNIDKPIAWARFYAPP
jgi:hypothetical protein